MYVHSAALASILSPVKILKLPTSDKMVCTFETTSNSSDFPPSVLVNLLHQNVDDVELGGRNNGAANAWTTTEQNV